jgi:hypothetical protein
MEPALVLVLRVVGHIRLLEIRDIVVLQLHEAPTLKVMKGADDARAAGINGPAEWRVVILGMRRPAAVEGAFGFGDDLTHRSLDPGRVPRLGEERLVAVWVEERQSGDPRGAPPQLGAADASVAVRATLRVTLTFFVRA